MQVEEFNAIPVGANVSFVYKPGTTPVSLSGKYLGMKDGKVAIRVYRTVNYGKGTTYDDAGNKIIKDYEPDSSSTYNDQTFDPWQIKSITTS